jgi:hypothetical protein
MCAMEITLALLSSRPVMVSDFIFSTADFVFLKEELKFCAESTSMDWCLYIMR